MILETLKINKTSIYIANNELFNFELIRAGAIGFELKPNENINLLYLGFVEETKLREYDGMRYDRANSTTTTYRITTKRKEHYYILEDGSYILKHIPSKYGPDTIEIKPRESSFLPTNLKDDILERNREQIEFMSKVNESILNINTVD